MYFIQFMQNKLYKVYIIVKQSKKNYANKQY